MVSMAGSYSHGESVKILLIGGYPRSGSTLLDRVLGELDGFVSLGEVRQVWSEGWRDNQLCGCGNRLRDCAFWRSVAGRTWGGEDPRVLQQILTLKQRVDRWWRVPQFALGAVSPRFRQDLGSYAGWLSRLYDAVSSASAAKVIIDSSKDISHAYVLTALPSRFQVFLVHLVRDSRAVAFSSATNKFDPGTGRSMKRAGVLRTSLEWDLVNLLTWAIGRDHSAYLRLRYEDFVTDPRGSISRILTFLNESPRALPIDEGGLVSLGVSHTVSGNPMRFHRGTLSIRPDEAWRVRIRRRDRMLVSAMTWPTQVWLRRASHVVLRCASPGRP